jgi:hypothetical protein
MSVLGAFLDALTPLNELEGEIALGWSGPLHRWIMTRLPIGRMVDMERSNEFLQIYHQL